MLWLSCSSASGGQSPRLATMTPTVSCGSAASSISASGGQIAAFSDDLRYPQTGSGARQRCQRLRRASPTPRDRVLDRPGVAAGEAHQHRVRASRVADHAVAHLFGAVLAELIQQCFGGVGADCHSGTHDRVGMRQHSPQGGFYGVGELSHTSNVADCGQCSPQTATPIQPHRFAGCALG